MMMNAAPLPASPLGGPSTLNSPPNEMNTNTVLRPWGGGRVAKSKKTLQKLMEKCPPGFVCLWLTTEAGGGGVSQNQTWGDEAFK